MPARQLMSTKEVAEYLRLKERKIYDMVAQEEIPHSRISGKLLFRARWSMSGCGRAPPAPR